MEIFQAVEQACELLDKSHGELDEKVEKAFKNFMNTKVLIIPVSYEITDTENQSGHGAVAIAFNHLFIKGGRFTSEPGLNLYLIQSCKDKMKGILLQLLDRQKFEENNKYFNDTTDEILDLKYLKNIKRAFQHGITCAWSSSAKLSLQGLFLAYLLKKRVLEADDYSSQMYHAWVDEDREIAMQAYLNTIPESWIKTQVLACIYRHLSDKKINQGSRDLIMEYIEKQAPLAVKIAEKVEISNDIFRVAQVKLHS